MKLILIRHGDADDDVLTAEGLAKTKRMGQVLACRPLGAVHAYCSAKNRTIVCADIIAKFWSGTSIQDEIAWCWGDSMSEGEEGYASFRKRLPSHQQSAVVITHKPDVERARLYFLQVGYRGIGEYMMPVDYMQGILVDTDEKTIEFISYDGK